MSVEAADTEPADSAAVEAEAPVDNGTSELFRLMAQGFAQLAAIYAQPQQYNLAIAYDDGQFGVERFDTIEGLIKQLKTFHKKDINVVPFIGVPLRMTRGLNKYLILPDGPPIALFEVDASSELDDTWNMGKGLPEQHPADDNDVALGNASGMGDDSEDGDDSAEDDADNLD